MRTTLTIDDDVAAELQRLRRTRDADLAALAIEHGLILCSTDGDLDRFPGLRWQNPLAA